MSELQRRLRNRLKTGEHWGKLFVQRVVFFGNVHDAACGRNVVPSTTDSQSTAGGSTKVKSIIIKVYYYVYEIDRYGD